MTALQQFPAHEQEFLFPGPAGNIQVLTDVPRGTARNKTVVICHPHPLHGGTMNNKVISTLHRTFRDMGLATVRFNFRGVDKSEGEHDAGVGETADVLTLLHWLQEVKPHDALWLAGFSFGAFVAANAANQYPVERLISIAPAVNHCDFTVLTAIRCPWLVVQGAADEVVPAGDVQRWAEHAVQKPEFIMMPETSHFFHGKLLELRQQLEHRL